MWRAILVAVGWALTILAILIISGMFFGLGLWIGVQILG